MKEGVLQDVGPANDWGNGGCLVLDEEDERVAAPWIGG